MSVVRESGESAIECASRHGHSFGSTNVNSFNSIQTGPSNKSLGIYLFTSRTHQPIAERVAAVLRLLQLFWWETKVRQDFATFDGLISAYQQNSEDLQIAVPWEHLSAATTNASYGCPSASCESSSHNQGNSQGSLWQT